MIRGRRSVAVVVLLIAGLLTVSAHAEDTVIKGTNLHHNTKWHSVDVGDVKGHVLGVHENKGVSLYATGERVELTLRGMVNWTNGSGPIHGYDIRRYPDGSVLTLEYIGEWRTSGTVSGEGKYVSCRGTGRFENVTCEGTWRGGRQGEGLNVVDWEVKLTRR